MEKNRELNELLGLCWHSPVAPAMSHVGGSVCKKCKQRFDANPDYADPRLVLREMERIGKLAQFIDSLVSGKELVNSATPVFWFLTDYITNDTLGKLRDQAIDWLKKEVVNG